MGFILALVMKFAPMGIQLPALGQNDPTEMVVWIFCSQYTAPPLRSTLVGTKKLNVLPLIR